MFLKNKNKHILKNKTMFLKNKNKHMFLKNKTKHMFLKNKTNICF